MNARLVGLASGIMGAAALVGCSLTQTALRQADALGQSGQLITPKRCRMDVMILSRPQGDATINETLWSVADEQVIETSKRQVLESNGLRFGIVTGELPSQVQDLVKAKPPNRPDVLTVINPVGTPNLIDPGQVPKPQLSLFLSLSGQKVKGKMYTDAKGYLRLTPSFDEASGISMRIVPELHHGPVLHGYGMVPQPTGLAAPAEFQIQNGQREDSFRELAVSLDLKPDQVAVFGCRPERPGSLGDVLFQRRTATVIEFCRAWCWCGLAGMAGRISRPSRIGPKRRRLWCRLTRPISAIPTPRRKNQSSRSPRRTAKQTRRTWMRGGKIRSEMPRRREPSSDGGRREARRDNQEGFGPWTVYRFPIRREGSGVPRTRRWVKHAAQGVLRAASGLRERAGDQADAGVRGGGGGRADDPAGWV